MSEFIENGDVRKNRILEAALNEFAEKGYRKASTNTIVREAEVSKGLLFHYYISKKELYITIYQNIVDIFNRELFEGVNFADRDVFNRLSASTVQKIDSYIQHPLFVRFIEHTVECTDEEILERTAKIAQKGAKEVYEKIFSNIDYFLFSDKIDINRSLDVVKWTIDRISQEWVKKNGSKYHEDTFGELEENIRIYIDLFRDAFYKEHR